MRFNLSENALAALVHKLAAAEKRSREDRKKLKELIAKAENILQEHGQRITQNEEDIQAGKEKLIDHEQRIAALENP